MGRQCLRVRRRCDCDMPTPNVPGFRLYTGSLKAPLCSCVSITLPAASHYLNVEKRRQAVPKKGILELRADSRTGTKVPNIWKCGEDDKGPFESINTDLCVLLGLFS